MRPTGRCSLRRGGTAGSALSSRTCSSASATAGGRASTPVITPTNKEGSDPDIALAAVAFTPARANRYRSPLMRWLVARQGWYFLPIRRVVGRGTVERRWVELTFLTVRLGGLIALVFWVLPPDKAVTVQAVQVAVFAFTMGSAFASTTSACRWCRRG